MEQLVTDSSDPRSVAKIGERLKLALKRFEMLLSGVREPVSIFRRVIPVDQNAAECQSKGNKRMQERNPAHPD
jgi:hypothetical protein